MDVQNPVKLGTGGFAWKITDMERRFNINSAPEPILQQALILMGVDAGQMTSVINSILDWIDPDDNPRIQGAESDYYQGEDPPYLARTGPSMTCRRCCYPGHHPRSLLGRRRSDQPSGCLLPATRTLLRPASRRPHLQLRPGPICSPPSPAAASISTPPPPMCSSLSRGSMPLSLRRLWPPATARTTAAGSGALSQRGPGAACARGEHGSRAACSSNSAMSAAAPSRCRSTRASATPGANSSPSSAATTPATSRF